MTTGSVSSWLRSSDLLLPVSMPEGEWLITKMSCSIATKHRLSAKQHHAQQHSRAQSVVMVCKNQANRQHRGLVILTDNLPLSFLRQQLCCCKAPCAPQTKHGLSAKLLSFSQIAGAMPLLGQAMHSGKQVNGMQERGSI